MAKKFSEEAIKQAEELDDLIWVTSSVAQLTEATKAINDVLLILLYNMKKHGFEMPDWKTKDDVEKSIGGDIQDCINKIREIYGPSETDKS